MQTMAFFSKDIILTTSPDGPVAAYDPFTGVPIAEFSPSRSPRNGLALAGNLIAVSHVSSSVSGFIRLYNWWSPSPLRCIPLPEPVAPLAASGFFLFAGGLSGRIHILSLPSGDLRRSFAAHRQPVSCLTINDDGSLLISGGDDGIVAVFPVLRLLDDAAAGDIYGENTSTPLALHQIPAHSAPVTGVTAGPGGCSSTITSCSLDGTVRFWRLADGAPACSPVHLPCAGWCIAAEMANTHVHVGGSDGNLYVTSFHKAKGKRVGVWTTEGRNVAVVAVVVVNGGKNVVAAGEDGLVRVWEVEKGEVVRVFGGGRGGISGVLVVAGGGGGERKGGGFEGRRRKREVGGGREVEEMEEWLSEVVKERKKAIDTLEAAICSYERLLGLLLREVKGGTGTEETKDPD